MYLIVPQITEISYDIKIDNEQFPGIKKFDSSKPFNSIEGPFLSKEEIKDFLIKQKVI
jgi:hypothetical protein